MSLISAAATAPEALRQVFAYDSSTNEHARKAVYQESSRAATTLSSASMSHPWQQHTTPWHPCRSTCRDRCVRGSMYKRPWGQLCRRLVHDNGCRQRFTHQTHAAAYEM